MRFVHVADVHLDTPFLGRSEEVRRRLRDASREAFRRAVDLTLDEGADALLIAGDLFDDERLSLQTERFLLGELGRLAEAGVQVVYATGNHDPGRANYRAHALPWPRNVHLVRGRAPERIPIHRRGGELVGFVTAAGHQTPRESEDLAARFPSPPAELPEVALLHTQVVGSRDAEAHDPYAPSELRELRRRGYDYWALGHVHLRQALSDDPPIWYAGNPQGRNPRETGPRGCLLVNLEDRRSPDVSFRPLAPVRWETLRVRELGDVTDLGALAARIVTAWERARADDPGEGTEEWIVRVELEGPSPLCPLLRVEEELRAAEEEVQLRLGALEAEVRAQGVRPPVDPGEHRERQDVLGAALRLVEELRRDPGGLLAVAPESLAEAPPGGEEGRARYLASLLDGAEEELVARIVGSAGGGRGRRAFHGEGA